MSGGSHDGDPPEMLPRLLKGIDVQQVFEVSRRTIDRWVTRGHLKPIRIGRSLFFHPDDIRELIAARLSRRP